MRKNVLSVLLTIALMYGTLYASIQEASAVKGGKERNVAYCTIEDLNSLYGSDRVSGWCRLNPDTVDKSIADAESEIDGYLVSGGYSVPISGPPRTIRKYCVDIAAANLIISCGVLEADSGGKAVLEQARIARHYLEKVAEGKFKIPGYSAGSEVSKPPTGNIQVSSRKRLDLRGY
jgi:phage gp36-like protein